MISGMRILLAILMLIIIGCISKRDEPVNIRIEKHIYNLDIPEQKSAFDLWVSQNVIDVPNDTTAKKYQSTREYKLPKGWFGTMKCHFEDRNFEIYSNCEGEFGGALYFVDKKNPDSIYYLSMTCPKMIDFQNGNYILTHTLAHMSGSAGVYLLSNPKTLPLVSKENLFTTKSVESENRVKPILDTFGFTASIYYPYKGRGFLVYSQYDTTYLGEVADRKIIHREPILNYSTWSYDDKLNRIKNGVYISDIGHISTSSYQQVNTRESIEGSIYFKENVLVLGYKYTKSVFKEEPPKRRKK